MKFVNNWVYELGDLLPAGSLDLPLPAGALDALGLADGEETVVTLLAGDQRTYEFVRVANDGGELSVQRGAFGSADAEWPAGSTIYAALPAEQMNEWQAQIADLLERVAELEQGGGGGGGGGITVGPAPTDAPTAEGEAILDGSALFIGRDTGDTQGWERFEAVTPSDGAETSSFLTVWSAPSIQRPIWAPDPGYIELSIGSWTEGGDVDAHILLQYAGTDALVIAGNTAGITLLANVAITDNLDGTASVPVGPVQMIHVSRRAATQTVIVCIEPLESLSL